MQEKTCRCGASKKRFKKDIGEFYIAECCEQAGFDHLGREKLPEGEVVSRTTFTVTTELQPGETQEQAEERVLKDLLAASSTDEAKPSVLNKIKSMVGLKPGRGKLRDMTRDALIKMAQDQGLPVKEGITKNELIALILG